MKTLSIIVPVYNENNSIPIFMNSITNVLDSVNYAVELIFINDGSDDNTQDILASYALRDARAKVIELSRNFGKEYALCAGFKHAKGDAIIPIDVDLQDPPALMLEFVKHWEQGADIVVGVRSSRETDSLWKRVTANLFYKIFRRLCGRRMIQNAGDYRLLSRKATEALNALPESVRFTKGLYSWIGFENILVQYDRATRSTGMSKWEKWKLWNFALDGITSFTTFPLRIWSYLGFCLAVFGIVYAIILICKTMIYGIDTPGYASLMVTILVVGGTILISLGIMGEYIGRIFEEVKRRPHYIIKNKINL